jgi:hypothetical protein
MVILQLGSSDELWYVHIMKPGMLWNLDKCEYALKIWNLTVYEMQYSQHQTADPRITLGEISLPIVYK